MPSVYTPNYNFELPDFDVSPWHDQINANFRSIDALIYTIFGLSQVKGPYQNSTTVVAGERYFDEVEGTLYEVVIGYTTNASPDTFEDDRIANPSNWKTLETEAVLGSVATVLAAEAATVIAKDAALAAQTNAETAETNAETAEINAEAAETAAVAALAAFFDAFGTDNNWTGENTFSNIVHIPDDIKLFLGDSDDLQIYHSGGNAFVQNLVGEMRIISNLAAIRLQGLTHAFTNSANTKTAVAIDPDAATSIAYNGVIKLATAAAGVNITGVMAASGNITGVGLALTGSMTGVNATLTGALSAASFAGAGFLNDATMAANSATKAVSQASIVGYVGAQKGGSGLIALDSPNTSFISTVVPSTANEITIHLFKAKKSSTGDFNIQLLPVVTGYASASALSSASAMNTIGNTTGFRIFDVIAANLLTGHITLKRIIGTNTWTVSGNLFRGTNQIIWIGGGIDVAGAITGIKFEVLTGTFEGGHIAIDWRI